MITQKDILADMHTHTIFSEHAFSTVMENIAQARKMNMKYLGITDHFYNKGDEITKKNEMSRIMYMQDEINSYEEDIKIIGSAEFNLNQDISDKDWKKYKRLSWRPIGLHTWFADIENTSLDALYSFFEEASKKYNCFCHIEREFKKIDGGKYYDKSNMDFIHEDLRSWFEKVVDLAYINDIYLEVNEGTLDRARDGDASRLRYWLSYARKKGCKISLGTDAHYAKEIGNFNNSIELLNELDYPKELILNCDSRKLDELCIKRR